MNPNMNPNMWNSYGSYVQESLQIGETPMETLMRNSNAFSGKVKKLDINSQPRTLLYRQPVGGREVRVDRLANGTSLVDTGSNPR